MPIAIALPTLGAHLVTGLHELAHTNLSLPTPCLGKAEQNIAFDEENGAIDQAKEEQRG